MRGVTRRAGVNVTTPKGGGDELGGWLVTGDEKGQCDRRGGECERR